MKLPIRMPLLLAASCLIFSTMASAHCEVPCGIYDDGLRLDLIAEHATTIEKSMAQIEELQAAEPLNYNQLVRWVNNKETHASEVQHIVSQYFMTQRIKPEQDAYAEKLQSLHRMLLHAMKCKQTTDPAHVTALREELEKFRGLYMTHDH